MQPAGAQHINGNQRWVELHDWADADRPKKLGKQLTIDEMELKLVSSKMEPDDLQNGKGQPNTCKESCSNNKRAIAEASRKLKDAIPREVIPKKAEKQCKLGE